ncbi:MAG: helical backbone metal receptor [Acidobacteriota bacterium]|nr:helical backbone metal receptor [Acidobacteriota bacterium]
MSEMTRGSSLLGRALPLLIAAAFFAACGANQPAPPASAPQRIVSIIPAVTETLFAIGAGPRVVGAGSYDTYPPEVAAVPRVGGLIDPDTERILALRPDLVYLFASQEDLARQLRAAGITVEIYQHGGLTEVIAGIRAIGARVGHEQEAGRIAGDIERRVAAVRERVKALPRPSTLIVFGREEGTLRGIYASAGIGFVHDMVEAAGGRNVFGDVRRQNVQASLESIIARRPGVILEIRAAAEVTSPAWRDETRRAWSAAASIPAVANGRIAIVLDERVVVPGPRIGEGIELLERALHGK